MAQTPTYYLGIDIAKYTHTFSLMDQDNQIIVKNHRLDNSHLGFKDLYASIKHYQQSGTVHLACEATGHYWLNLFQFLLNKHLELSVFNPLQVASFRNSKLRGNKTDSDDSILIAKVLKFGLAQPRRLPTEQNFELKELSRFRTNCKQQSTAVKLKVMHILDQVFPEFMTVFKSLDGKTAKQILTNYPNPKSLETISTGKLTQVLAKASRKYYGKEQAQDLKQKASQSIGLRFGIDVFAFQMKLLLQQLENLDGQISLIDQRMTELVKESQTSLVSIPGISYVIAGTILGECATFKSQGPQAFLAFAGLDPRKHESGVFKGKAKVSKRGSRNLRQALWMAANSARLCSPTFKKVYESQISRGKHHNVAINHVAKKLAYVVDHLMQTNEPFKEQSQRLN